MDICGISYSSTNGNVPSELIMTNLGIPLTGSLAIGFTIGFMRG